MKRSLMIAVAAVLIPVAGIIASSGAASAAGTLVDNGAPHTIGCNTTGGTLTFKTPIGIVTPGGYQAPTKNKGNQITLSGISLSACTGDLHALPLFSGTFSAKIKISNPSQTPAQFYSCANLNGKLPAAGGTLSGTAKIKWTPPSGFKFTQKKSTIAFSDVDFGFDSGTSAYFFDTPGFAPLSISGGFPGNVGGSEGAFGSPETTQTAAAITAQCQTPGGVSSIPLGGSEGTYVSQLG
jgi:hypothetical protein